jgi:hypothetical protein
MAKLLVVVFPDAIDIDYMATRLHGLMFGSPLWLELLATVEPTSSRVLGTIHAEPRAPEELGPLNSLAGIDAASLAKALSLVPPEAP